MAFTRGTNNQQNRRNATTTLNQLYNQDAGGNSSTLKIGFWNKMASIAVSPILPDGQRRDGRVYDYDHTVSVLLTPDEMEALRALIDSYLAQEKRLIEAKSQEKVQPMALETSKGFIEFGGAGLYDGVNDHFVQIYQKSQDGKVIESVAIYIFHRNTILKNFSAEDPAASKTVAFEGDLNVFKSFIKYSCDNVIAGGAHGVNASLIEHFGGLEEDLAVLKALVERGFVAGGNDAGGNGGGGYASRRSNGAAAQSTGGAAPRRLSGLANAAAQTAAPAADTGDAVGGEALSEALGGEETNTDGNKDLEF